jgi:thiol-disulfide isomerase/thioredoxin
MKTIIFIIYLLSVFIELDAQTISNFHLKDVENRSRTYSELKGDRLTLIDFWASWCMPCLKAIPELNRMYELYEAKGVQIIGINCDGPRSVSKVAPLIKSLQINYPILMDLNSEVMNNLNLNVFPTLILVNDKGKIVWIHEGFVAGDTETITAEIEKELKAE